MTTPHQINQLNANAVRVGEVRVGDALALERHLWYQLETFDSVTAVYISSENREHVAVERSDNGSFQVKVSGDSTGHEVRIYAADRPGHRTKLLRPKPNYDPRTRPWYTSALERTNEELESRVEQRTTELKRLKRPQTRQTWPKASFSLT